MTTTLCLSGELDVSTVDEFTRTVERHLEQTSRVQLDLSEVSVIDSAGILALLEAVRRSGGRDGRLTVCEDLHPDVRRLMERAGLLSLLPIQ